MITRSRPHSKANPGWFAKGRSGNPKGRPSSSRASKGSAFEVLVEKTLTVDDKGGTREITVEEALQHRTYQDALAGKRMAVREVVKWIIKREAWLEKNAVKRSGQCGCRSAAPRYRGAQRRARGIRQRPGATSP